MSDTKVANGRTPNRKGFKMTFKASGARNSGKNAPRHKERNAPGTDKNPFGKRPSKEDLLARMKAVADARKAAK